MNAIAQILAPLARFVLRRDWRALQGKLRTAHSAWVKSGLRPAGVIVNALLLAEDRRFHRHSGVDPISIAAIPWRYVRYNRVSGASTIEQQLVRVISGRYERTVRRKIREILLASLVSSCIPKEDIPAVYLSVAYYGWRMTGLRQAAQRLGICLSSPTCAEAASLVARINYPEPQDWSLTWETKLHKRVAYLTYLLAASQYRAFHGARVTESAAVSSI